VVEALKKVLTPEQQAKLPKTSTAKTSAAKTTTKKPAEGDSE
jgi:Spy/CpxP family protein refolding chaperone